MTTQEIIDYCLQKPGAYTDCPFGPESLCVKVEGRIFADLFFKMNWLTLKCTPADGLALRQAYPGCIRRGYHCPPVQQPYNNTITLDGTVSDALLREMMDRSYEYAVSKLTREARARIPT